MADDSFRRNSRPPVSSWFSPLIHITGPVADTEINSNLFIKSSVSLGSTIIEMDNWGGAYPINTNINRNIFYVEQTYVYYCK